MKLTSINGSVHPEVRLCYDSTSVGEQTIGNWEARQQPQLMRTLRSLLLLIEQRFQVHVSHHHIYGHSGDPGNELVDTLAWKAGQGNPLVDAKHFLDWIQTDDFVSDFSWAWFLFRSDVPLRWQGSQLVLPAGPSTSPPSDVIKIPHLTLTPVVCDLRLCLATLNVLTLKGKDSLRHGLQGPTRQQVVLQQLFDAGANIFALQETRQKRQSSATDERYILFASPATTQGHFGLTVGFDKLRPHGTITDSDGQSREVLFRKEHFSIISRAPRYLILKVHTPLHSVVLSLQAMPHTLALLQMNVEDGGRSLDNRSRIDSCIGIALSLPMQIVGLGTFLPTAWDHGKRRSILPIQMFFFMTFFVKSSCGFQLPFRNVIPGPPEPGDITMAVGIVEITLQFRNVGSIRIAVLGFLKMLMLHWQKKTIVQPLCNFGPPVNSLANPPSGNLPPLMKKPCYQQLLLTLRTFMIASRTDQSQVGPPMCILMFNRYRLVLPLYLCIGV